MPASHSIFLVPPAPTRSSPPPPATGSPLPHAVPEAPPAGGSQSHRDNAAPPAAASLVPRRDNWARTGRRDRGIARRGPSSPGSAASVRENGLAASVADKASRQSARPSPPS